MNATTHEVFNQSQPFEGVNLFDANQPLRDALARFAPWVPTDALEALGGELGRPEMLAHARLANHHAPVLHSHDRQGRRIDEVEFHPAYHALLGAALQHGLHGTAWGAGAGRHVERAAGFMLFSELEPAVLCPVSMTYAVTPALRANPALELAFGEQLRSTAYDARHRPAFDKTAVTMGMGMTEKQGGSDVRANTTRAEFDGEDGWGRRFRLTGHKWFMSAPMCDAFLVVAQTAAGPSCFFVPRWCRDDSLNTLHFQRLKHKLGNQANASSEVEFQDAAGWLVGEEGRGLRQILAMGALTRLDCALGTAGLMRHALSLALDHTAQRQAFGRALITQPLMKSVLADLALESEAATVLALRVAASVDRSETLPSGTQREYEALMRRVLTPVAKFWICKRGSHFAQEAMECLGGNGYVEAQGEGVMARIYREMPLNSIWEGAGNIMALDLQRALAGPRVREVLAAGFESSRGAHPALDRAVGRLLADLARPAAATEADADTDPAGGRRLVRDIALVMQATLLCATAPEAVSSAFCASRLDGASDVFGALPPGLDLDFLIERARPR